MCRDEDTANTETSLLKEDADEKATIKNGCIDVITSGFGRKGLAPMAKALLESKPTSKKFIKKSNGFGNPTGTSSSSTSFSSHVQIKRKKEMRRRRHRNE